MDQEVTETGSASRDRGRLLWLCAASVIAVALVIALGVYLSPRGRPLTAETFHHLFGGISPAEAENREDISKIVHYFGVLEIVEIDPPLEFRQLFRPNLVAKYRQHDGFYWPLPPNVLAGVDRFGTPYKYDVTLVGREEHSDGAYTNVYELTVRSVGADRRDDKGRGDDFQRSVRIGVHHSRESRE